MSVANNIKDIKLTGALILTSSAIAYNFGFLKGLGLKLTEIPVTTGELLADWKSCLIFIISFLLGLLTSSSRQPILRKDSFGEKIIQFLCGLNLILYLLFGGSFFLTIGIFSVAFILEGIVEFLTERLNLDNWTRVCLMIAGLNFLFGFNFGLYQKTHEASMRLELKTTGEDLIRTIGDWSLIRYDENRYGWVNNQSKLIVNVKAADEFRGFLTKDSKNQGK